MNQLVADVLQPLAMTIASILIPVIVGYVADRVRRWTGIEIEARHREALQSALANAASVVLKTGRVDDGVDYVIASVPDAVAALKVNGTGYIEDLLEPHVERARLAKGK